MDISQTEFDELKKAGRFELLKAIIQTIQTIKKRPRDEGLPLMLLKNQIKVPSETLNYLLKNGFLTSSSCPLHDTSEIRRGYNYTNLPMSMLKELGDSAEAVRKLVISELEHSQLKSELVEHYADLIVKRLIQNGLIASFTQST